MTDRKKDFLCIAVLFTILVASFAKVLFTDQIIRAPDIINEFYWGVKGIENKSFPELFRMDFSSAGWEPYINSGYTQLGGMSSIQLLSFRNLIFWLIPSPANVAWFIVLHLYFGALGAYFYCRCIGCSRIASLFGGMIFALATENASLINAGHVMKIATISFAPWAFFVMERGYRTLRPVYFFTAGVVLAFQFFNIHWQIAFYTCLALAVYGSFRTYWLVCDHNGVRGRFIARMLGLNLITLIFFLCCVSISLVPLASWSKDTNRGAHSGANQGKGGLDREEAMAWSMPPEETAALFVPGIYGFSRQEAGQNPPNIPAYYWGRMVFTQTMTYMGLLPWLLLPLPLIFRRDRVTQIAGIVLVFGILFSMGKYTPFYNLLYDYLPGIDRFRVPKMMMFIPLLALGVLAARGLDILKDGEVLSSNAFRRYILGLGALVAVLAIFLVVERFAPRFTINLFSPQISEPTRYEEGSYLIGQRWNNMVNETAIATLLAALCTGIIYARYRLNSGSRIFVVILLALFVGDVARVNAKFLLTVPVPDHVKGRKTPVIEFLQKEAGMYRVLPMDGSDPMHLATNKIAAMFTSNPVQQRRWQDFLDTFSTQSAMPDMLNVKYLIVGAQEYEKEKMQFGQKYIPVFSSPVDNQTVLENRDVLPKAWLVSSAAVITDQNLRLNILNSASFNPLLVALVENQPPIPLKDPNDSLAVSPSYVQVVSYKDELIELNAEAASNVLLVLGEKYFQGWHAVVDGKKADIYPVNHVLRGVYLPPGKHTVEFVFDPLPFKIGKYVTLVSLAGFAGLLIREWRGRRKNGEGLALGEDAGSNS